MPDGKIIFPLNKNFPMVFHGVVAPELRRLQELWILVIKLHCQVLNKMSGSYSPLHLNKHLLNSNYGLSGTRLFTLERWQLIGMRSGAWVGKRLKDITWWNIVSFYNNIPNSSALSSAAQSNIAANIAYLDPTHYDIAPFMAFTIFGHISII